ncbi:MAG: hypothetical protein IJP67_03825 [Oscillospiraceae bacterium]|nr:hypothetical protein [Oscillospiraceae bacterium]
MKDMKIKETLKDAAEQANKAVGSAMQELGDDELDEIAGAGNPFANVARVPTQPIDEDMRNKG